MAQRYFLAVILILWVIGLASCGGNAAKREFTYYCLPGYHLADGECIPDTDVPTDGDRLDGDAVDGDISDGDPSDGDIVDGDLSDGDMTDGDLSDGDGADGDWIDGDMTEADATDGDGVDGEASDGDVIDGDGIDGEAESYPRLTIRVPERVILQRTSGMRAFWHASAEADPQDVSDQVEWISFNPTILRVEESPPRFYGVALGQAGVRAKLNEQWSDLFVVHVMERAHVEARGLWVNRWAWSDAADIAAIFEKAADHGFNQVYFQVRGVFDAYYQSDLEPWAKRLSGTLGGDPGWDPLQTAIDEARANDLQLHAWINVFTCWEGGSAPTESTPRHVYIDHPDWVMQDASHVAMPLGSGYIWCSPGNGALRAHNAAVVADIVSRYDVAGIHLDRVRYPADTYSYDAASEAAFAEVHAADSSLTYHDWERAQVTAQVAQIYAAIGEHNPGVALTAAVGGIYRDTFGWGGVTEAYSDWLQDWAAWDELEIIDAVIPMVYWQIRPSYADWTDFRALVDAHSAMITNRFLFIGSDLNATGDAERGKPKTKAYEPFSQIDSQIGWTRLTGADGWVMYDYSTLEAVDYWDELSAGPFALDAVAPFMWWKAQP